MFGVIIGIDIKDFSKTVKTNEMLIQRKEMVKIINDGVADIDAYKKRNVLDTGDGCYILIDSGDYEHILLGLKKIQLKAKENGTMKFRGIVHIGKFEKTTKIFDENTATESFVGEGINEASRYLDAQCLKDMLKNNNQNFVYGISNELYMQVFDQQYHQESEFLRYVFHVKEYKNQIFLNIAGIDNLPPVDKITNSSNYAGKSLKRLWY